MTVAPSALWRMLDQRVQTKPLPRGLDALWNSGLGLVQRLVPRRRSYLRRAERIVAVENDYTGLPDAKLQELAAELRTLFRLRRERPEDLDLAFALIREAAFRQIGEKPFPVQVAGALALHDGCVVEMATGEGKTLTATMPATVAGWRGLGCHIVTVNDYLAKRDAEWMGRIYRFLGVSVACIEQPMPPEERHRAYLADITYLTNKEVSADFLRDRLILGRVRGLSAALLAKHTAGGRQIANRLVQRGLAYAIIDEADSILIDEAVTPLIISGEAPNPEQSQTFQEAAAVARELQAGPDYRIDERFREVELTKLGKQRVSERGRALGGLWCGARRSEELVTQALTAKDLYTRGKQYIVEDDKIVIVDEFTGRLMPDRTWRDGLHQAVEAKESLTVKPPKDTYARISFQRFFRLYRRLAGMTGTAAESRAEFWQIYGLPVVVIPTNRPCIRARAPHVVMSSDFTKWQRILEEIRRVHATGRPILVGTRSIRTSELLSELLKAEGLEHQVLNAVYHREEAQIIARAGQPGKITVATNMAGRGTDIKLGEGIAAMGGLCVIAAEPNQSMRVDRQLFGRGARQGDPGSAVGIFCLDDEVLTRYAKHLTKFFKRRHGDTTREISSPILRALVSLAQRRAERLALRQRRAVLRTDHWLDEQLGFAGME